MDLSELIDAHRGGRSYNELARDCGVDAPSGKRLQQLATGTMKNFPDPPTIRALARGLRVPHTAVVLAAAESLGLNVRQSLPRVVELLPASARDLSEEQAAAIAHLVSAFLEPSDTRLRSGRMVADVVETKSLRVAHLKAVALDGDAASDEHQAAIDELAKLASLEQRGTEE